LNLKIECLIIHFNFLKLFRMIKVLHLGFCTIIQVRVLVDIISLDVPFSGVYTFIRFSQ
jgi:hypothetical protein